MENMLERKVEKRYGMNKGAMPLVGAIVSLLVGIILVVAVGIPVTNQVITSSNLTGTTATVVNTIPIFLGLVPLLLVAGLYGLF